MRIRYLTGPAAGEVRHVENTIGRDAIDSGRAVAAPDRSIPVVHAPIEPQWSVKVIGTERPTLAIVLKMGSSVTSYTGEPGKENERIEWQGGSDGKQTFGRYKAFGRVVPDEVCDEYKQAWKNHKALRGGNAATAAQAADAAEAFREKQFKLFERSHAPGTPNPYAKKETPAIRVLEV